MVIAWRNLRPWEIVVFWAVIAVLVVGTVVLQDHVWDVSTRGPVQAFMPLRTVMSVLGVLDPCDGQGPLCVAA